MWFTERRYAPSRLQVLLGVLVLSISSFILEFSLEKKIINIVYRHFYSRTCCVCCPITCKNMHGSIRPSSVIFPHWSPDLILDINLSMVYLRRGVGYMLVLGPFTISAAPQLLVISLAWPLEPVFALVPYLVSAALNVI